MYTYLKGWKVIIDFILSIFRECFEKRFGTATKKLTHRIFKKKRQVIYHKFCFFVRRIKD